MEMIFYLVGSTLEIASEPLQIGRKWSSFDNMSKDQERGTNPY